MSLQRAEHGEQPVWMAVVLAAMLGQIGLPGGGFAYALGATSNTGKPPLAVPLPNVPTGRNSVADFIPVARIADMLLHPGEKFDYDGQRLAYPDIRLVYWAGGNPFHHHQDLNRLRRAFARPDTVIVHESAWTASARHADIVLPATITLEREDIGATAGDPLMVAMHRAVAPYREARDDHAICVGLAERLGFADQFTEGRSARQWLETIYEPTRRALAERGVNAPDFAQFWEDGELALPTQEWDGGMVRAFRRDPDAAPLPTPSGRIEIASATIAGFGYADCPGHPTWLPPLDGAGSPTAASFPLQLVANQPATRLHSQLDFGATSGALGCFALLRRQSLVGDTLAHVVLGSDDTLPATVDVMIHHTAAVARAKPGALIVGDMPWLSYHVSVEEAVRNAGRFIREGRAECVKLEGGRKRLAVIEAILAAEVDRHPDPICEAVRWHICEGELVQIIGRARGINRTEADPVDVLVMTDAPLPLPLSET
jgi:hypothetical protein